MALCKPKACAVPRQRPGNSPPAAAGHSKVYETSTWEGRRLCTVSSPAACHTSAAAASSTDNNNTTLQVQASPPESVCTGLSLVACQILTVPSSLQLASSLPDGSHRRLLMSALCAPCVSQAAGQRRGCKRRRHSNQPAHAACAPAARGVPEPVQRSG